MISRKLILAFICIPLFILSAHAAGAREISGRASLKLTKPATAETMDILKQKASRNFKIDLWEWMREEADVTVDTSNAIQRYHFFTFVDSCLSRAKNFSRLDDHTMIVSITMPGEDVRQLLQEYNTRCFSISLRFYTLMKKAVEDTAIGDLYAMGIQTIFYTMGRMGTPIGMSDESTPRSFLLQDARKIMQDFFNRFSVRTDEMLIAGQCGSMLGHPLKVKMLINNSPLTNVLLAGYLPGGKKICKGMADNGGTVSFDNFRIPFVAKGTMLYFRPDVAAPVAGVAPFEAIDLGLSLPEQALLFNTSPATYSLSYSATSANQIPVPKDFASDVFVKKFLKDSCYLVPAAATQQPNMYITINTQLSSYSNDETEQTTRKLDNEVIVADSTKRIIHQERKTAFEKVFENSIPIQEGLFFWEAAQKSMRMIKNAMNDL